jgi:heptosyltransferase-2
MPDTPRRILIIGPSNIGDAILAGDVVAIARQRVPGAHLTLVVGERAQALFLGDPRINTLVNADAFASLPGRVKLAVSLWRYQPHVLIDLRHTLYALLLKPLTCWRYFLQPPRTLSHMRQRHLWKFRAQAPGVFNASGAGNGSSVWASDKDRAHVEQLWRRWKLQPQDQVVVMCPGARSHIKRWTAEGFARIADRLIDEAGVHVVMTGEPSEEEIVEEIVASMHRKVYNAVGLLTIRQLGVAMQRAALVITNDSGALHMASAVRAPTVAIFGPTDAAKYGPTAPRHRAIRRRLFCVPCEQALCRFNHECMRFIAPDEVFAGALELLKPQA